jgi:probable HAF family extracellular repeat protein
VDLGTLGGSSADAQAINAAGQITGESGTATGAGHGYLRTGTLMSDIHPASGSLAGGVSFPWGLNSAGNVVGQWNGTTNQSFLWTPAGGMQLLPTLGGTHGVALDINDNGQVVGWSDPAPGQQDEAYIFENGTIRRLGTLGAAGSVATAINQLGVVVGGASTRRTQHAFYWTALGGMNDLGLPRGSSFGQALDINAGGWIVGEVSGGNGQPRAVLWRLPEP